MYHEAFIYRIYVTDCLKGYTHFNGKRYADIIEDVVYQSSGKQDNPNEIINRIKNKLGGKEGNIE